MVHELVKYKTRKWQTGLILLQFGKVVTEFKYKNQNVRHEHDFVSTTHLQSILKKKENLFPLRNGAAIKHHKCQIINQVP